MNQQVRRILFPTGVVVISLVFVLFSSKTTDLAAQSVNLTWEANTEPDLTGYRLYRDMDSGVYGACMDVENTTKFTQSNLAEGETYYYSVTAYDE